jgi:electron transport complex protein RnfB
MSEQPKPTGQPAETGPIRRRQFLVEGARAAALMGLGGLVGLAVGRSARAGTVWQIDPDKCVWCGNCATHCVLVQSAVKCTQAYAMCGYCQLCTGYFEPNPNDLNTGAENCLCPTGAIKRTFVEDPYYEYAIDEQLCTGCARCVEGCTRFGNGSFSLQIRHDRCLNCNECAISRACPGDAFRRVPSASPSILKANGH